MNSNTDWQETTEKAAEALLKSIVRTLNLHLHHRSACVVYGQAYAPEWALETTKQIKFTTEHVVVPNQRISIRGRYIWTSPIDLLYAFVNSQQYYVPIAQADKLILKPEMNGIILNPFYGLTPEEIQIKIDLECNSLNI